MTDWKFAFGEERSVTVKSTAIDRETQGAGTRGIAIDGRLLLLPTKPPLHAPRVEELNAHRGATTWCNEVEGFGVIGGV
jgi:hypothetical protein